MKILEERNLYWVQTIGKSFFIENPDCEKSAPSMAFFAQMVCDGFTPIEVKGVLRGDHCDYTGAGLAEKGPRRAFNPAFCDVLLKEMMRRERGEPSPSCKARILTGRVFHIQTRTHDFWVEATFREAIRFCARLTARGDKVLSTCELSRKTGRSVRLKVQTLDEYSEAYASEVQRMKDGQLAAGDEPYTPEFANIVIRKIFRSVTEMEQEGYTIPTRYAGEFFSIAGLRHSDGEMEFAAANIA